jgi:hypothetical protein
MSINLTLSSFQISNTRALHEDTDYVCVGMSVNKKVVAPLAKKVGNVNNGVHQVGLTFPLPNEYSATDQFVFSYLIINHGGGKTENVLTDCQNAVSLTSLMEYSTADAQVVSFQGRNLPQCFVNTERSEDILNNWWNQIKAQFNHLSTDRCDGPVAIDRFSFLGSSMADVELFMDVSTFSYQGIHSAVGCGSNSDYNVNWTIKVT